MDANKVDGHMRNFAAILGRGDKLTPKQREFHEKVQAAPYLDRPDLDVLVESTDPINFNHPVWESYQGIADFSVEDGGVLKAFIVGVDADGDFTNVRVLVWPRGRWLKAESKLTRIENPYYVVPDGF